MTFVTPKKTETWGWLVVHLSHTWAAQKSVTRLLEFIDMNLVTPKDTSKRKLLFIKVWPEAILWIFRSHLRSTAKCDQIYGIDSNEFVIVTSKAADFGVTKFILIICSHFVVLIEASLRRHDIQHNDTQHNDIQHNDTQHNDIQHNDTQHKGLV